MEFFVALVGGIFVIAFLQVFIPIVIQLVDAILIFIVKAPFRWLAHRFRMQLDPYHRGVRRATEGAFLLAACAYASTWFPVFIGHSLNDLVGDFWRSPVDRPGVGVFFAVAALSAIWLVVGVRGARGGDRDPMVAFWAAVVVSVCLAALWRGWLPPWPDRTYGTLLLIATLKGVYVATATAGLMRLGLSMPLPNNALRIVSRFLQQRNAPLVAARRRRFLFW
jgi:hypothetical protein